MKTYLQFPPAVDVHGVFKLLLQRLAARALPQKLPLDVVDLPPANTHINGLS